MKELKLLLFFVNRSATDAWQGPKYARLEKASHGTLVQRGPLFLLFPFDEKRFKL